MSAFYNVDQPPFNIRSSARAIAAANNGLLFDIGDMSTLYQDAAGTTPVTAVEQPVGLILDKSRGLMLGPELVMSGAWGGFAQGVTYTSGVFTLSNVTTALAAANNFVVKGKYYQVSFTIQSITTGSVSLTFEGGIATTPAYNSIGTYSAKICATASGNLFLYNRSALTTAVVSNISVREIYGNHATQSVTASRPTLSARKNILLATETLATQSVTSIAAQYTLSFTGTGSVTLSGTATGTLTGTGVNDRVSLTVIPTAGTLTLTVSGSVTKAQLELGTSAGPYQRVTTATDYDTDPRYFPKYLKFDGVDDYLNLPYMGLYANGSASVVAALIFDRSKLGNLLLEGCSTIASSAYGIYQRMDAALWAIARNDINVDSLSTSSLGLSPFTYRAVVSFTDTGNSAAWFHNANRLSNNSYTRSGVVTLNTLTLGAFSSNGVINGQSGFSLYGLIITKSALTDAQRVRCERFLARKAGVML